jgi:hypothetical protein
MELLVLLPLLVIACVISMLRAYESRELVPIPVRVSDR